MIDDVVRALNERAWPRYVEARYGQRVGDRLAPLLQPVVGARVAEPEPVPVGASKLGGLPDVDSSFEWPHEDGTEEPLALVGQINLSEVDNPGLPARGLLYLFCIYDGDRAYGYEIDETTSRVVFVPDPGPLAPAPRPDGLADDGILVERGLGLGPALIAEEADENGGHRHARFDHEVENALTETVTALGGAPCGAVQLLGHPHPFRSETRAEVDGSAVLLWYVNGYETDRHAFGEGDFLLVIDPEDLRAGRLHRADVIFEPGT